jgi:kinesin family protein C2/C3
MDCVVDGNLAALDPTATSLLREALINAWSVGLDCSKEAALAEAVLGEKISRWDFVLEELRGAAGDAAAAEAAVRNGDVNYLCGIQSRLREGLATARKCKLPGSKLEDAERHRRWVSSVIQDLKGQIRVFCRIRDMPLNRQCGLEFSAPPLKVVDATTVEVQGVGAFIFDRVFSPDNGGSQAEVFEECRDLVESAVDGHNVTIFAYGQTGAGKTYTMLGTDGQEGVAFRVISDLFWLADCMRQDHRVEVCATMVEMYNNRLFDLGIGAGGRGGALGPREALRDGEVLETPVQSASELQSLLVRGLAQRAVGANAFNIVSSRSHFVFGIHVTTTNCETGEAWRGKILLCDLGGAERLKRSDVTGDRQKEAIEINKSLTALGDVIEAITKKQPAVPYRNHRLTRLLQDSVGGAAKTVMFVNCSPAPCDLSETIMSLKYGARANRIENKGLAAETMRRLETQRTSASRSPSRSPCQQQH